MYRYNFADCVIYFNDGSTFFCSSFLCSQLVVLLANKARNPLHYTERRVPTAPGKPGKMTTVFPVLEKYWNFIILLKILENGSEPGKMNCLGKK